MPGTRRGKRSRVEARLLLIGWARPADPMRCDNSSAMDPARKRKIRLIVALSAAVLLAAGLVYTSFSASTEAKQPSDLISSNASGTYDLTGKVVPGSIERTD